MADRAALAGSAVVEASAAMLAPGSRPTLDELLEICMCDTILLLSTLSPIIFCFHYFLRV